MKMSVYVDDNVIAGPNLKELGAEMALILKEFPGREIPAEHIRNARKYTPSLSIAHGQSLLWSDEK